MSKIRVPPASLRLLPASHVKQMLIKLYQSLRRGLKGAAAPFYLHMLNNNRL